MKLKITSGERYRASAAERRAHGGSTVTLFFIEVDGAMDTGRDLPRGTERGMWVGYGQTPGARKTDAAKRWARARNVAWEHVTIVK